MTQKEEKQIAEIRQAHLDRIEELKEVIAEMNPEALFADGFDRSIMGYDKDGRVIYSVDSIIETLVERDGMDWEEASEYFSFNIEGAYVGEYTPVYMYQQ
jgi:hypothetical protein